MASSLEPTSVMAGFFASLASVFSKLALEEGTVSLKKLTCPSSAFCLESQSILYILQGLSLLMVVLCNVVMWVLFARSLQKHSSTAQSTVTVSTCNFLFSSLFGWGLFQETLSLTWWSGLSLIIIGFILMTT